MSHCSPSQNSKPRARHTVRQTGDILPSESCDATTTPAPALDSLPLYHCTIHNERSSHTFGSPAMPRNSLGHAWRVSLALCIRTFSHTMTVSFLSLIHRSAFCLLDGRAWLCCGSVKDCPGDMKMVRIQEIIQQ